MVCEQRGDDVGHPYTGFESSVTNLLPLACPIWKAVSTHELRNEVRAGS
jgi:hypothetical protein